MAAILFPEQELRTERTSPTARSDLEEVGIRNRVPQLPEPAAGQASRDFAGRTGTSQSQGELGQKVSSP